MNDVTSLTIPANLSEWLTLANVLLTATFAGLTFFILRANRAAVGAMREQMADQNRPFVAVTVQVRMGTPVIQLLVRNVGRSPGTMRVSPRERRQPGQWPRWGRPGGDPAPPCRGPNPLPRLTATARHACPVPAPAL